MSYAGDITPQQAWELLQENPDAVLVDVPHVEHLQAEQVAPEQEATTSPAFETATEPESGVVR